MKRTVISLLLVALSLAACAQSKQIGNPDVLKGIKETPTQSPTPKATKTGRATARPSPTTAPTTARPKAVAGSFTVVIRDTTRGYEPQVFQVFQGARVTFKNQDFDCPQKPSDPTCSHSWTADDGTWDSKAVPAGRSFTYVANKVGTFNFHDEQVPYLHGQMRVLPIR